MLQVLAADPAFRDDPRFHFVLTLRSEFRFRCRISDAFWSFIDTENSAKEKIRHIQLDERSPSIAGSRQRAG